MYLRSRPFLGWSVPRSTAQGRRSWQQRLPSVGSESDAPVWLIQTLPVMPKLLVQQQPSLLPEP